MTARIYINRQCTNYTEVSDEDYAFLSQWTWSEQYDKRGKLYVRRRICNVTIYMHRVVMRRVCRPPTDRHIYVDHQDGDGIHNIRGNLRWATPSENALNLNDYGGMQAHVARRAREAGMAPPELDAIPWTFTASPQFPPSVEAPNHIAGRQSHYALG